MNTSFFLGMLVAFLFLVTPPAAFVVMDGEISWWETLLLVILLPVIILILWMVIAWFLCRKFYDILRRPLH